jgi:hypothetical protein
MNKQNNIKKIWQHLLKVCNGSPKNLTLASTVCLDGMAETSEVHPDSRGDT